MQSKFAHSFYIAYSVSDRSLATAIAHNLCNNNIALFFDLLDLQPGEEVDHNEIIGQSSGMVVILSPFALIDKKVLNQIKFALANKVRIFAVLAVSVELPHLLKKAKAIDFTTDYKKGMNTLQRVLQKYGKSIPTSSALAASTSPAKPTNNIFRSMLNSLNPFKQSKKTL